MKSHLATGAGPREAARDVREAQVWKALADATRRGLLDLLRQGPRTTGDLASHFDTSRFAVMKHLGVLQRAGLVHVRRRGRERWNYLDPVPLRRVYERWVDPLAGEAAAALLRLDRLVTPEPEPSPMPDQGATRTNESRSLQLAIEIAAPRERVWRALVDETASWWPADFTTAESKAFVIEPVLGGRGYEDWGDGQGLIWFTVNAVRRGERLDTVGDSSGAWGGPNRQYTSFELKDCAVGTKLSMSLDVFGQISEQTLRSLDEGWQLLLGQALKDYAEAAA